MEHIKPKNENYCGNVVELKTFVALEGCTNVKAALIAGYSVIVSIDAKEGDVGVFFPTESFLDAQFLSKNNLYRDATLNEDTSKKGYFETHGRVKCLKFRGKFPSEGFFVPLSFFSYLLEDVSVLKVGDIFDELNGTAVCGKYIPRGQKSESSSGTKQNKPTKKLKDYIAEGQFSFHIDTPQFGKNVHRLLDNKNLDNVNIIVTDKWHGTSAIYANVKVFRNLAWYEKLLQKIGVKIDDKKYGMVTSSRRVIKSIDGVSKTNSAHYYEEDVWSLIGKNLRDRIPEGYTVYGEIVGYTPGGKCIQKGYHYGCSVGSHKFVVYRVSFTNDCGTVVELTWDQLVEFCSKYGLEHVKLLYRGSLANFLTTYSPNWDYFNTTAESVLNTFISAYLEVLCYYNNYEVPSEGIVIRIDHLDTVEFYKLKSFLFRAHESKENDSGEIDIETAESEEE